jgi:hypothetical protein
MVSVGTQLSDKDVVLHMEHWEFYSRILAFVRYPYERPPLEFANGIQSLLIRFFA